MKKPLGRLMSKVCLLLVLLVWVPVTQGQAITTVDTSATFLKFSSLVIEDGYSSTPQSLAKIAGCDTFTLKITSGLARFANKATSLTMKTCDALSLPKVFPGPLGDEGYIEIASRRMSKPELLRIATVERGNVAALQDIFGKDATYALWGNHFALVNEALLPATDKAIGGTLNLSVDIGDNSQLSANAVNDVCSTRVPWGPGKVNWMFSNPRGSGYSVKPETSNDLVWAQPPSQDIDGIYRGSWGNCTALKVPDNCTVYFYSDDTSSKYCCNAEMVRRGYIVKFVNTCSPSSPEASWPDAPLR